MNGERKRTWKELASVKLG